MKVSSNSEYSSKTLISKGRPHIMQRFCIVFDNMYPTPFRIWRMPGRVCLTKKIITIPHFDVNEAKGLGSEVKRPVKRPSGKRAAPGSTGFPAVDNQLYERI